MQRRANLPPLLLSVLAAAVLAGCASYRGIEPVARMQPPEAYAAAAAPLPVRAQEQAPWWRELGDPQLDALVERALAGSPSLRLARTRIDRARAVLEVADAAVLPQVNGTLDITHQRYTERGLIPRPLAGTVNDTGTLQVGAGWEFDFFGRYAQALQAALGAERAAQADADAARAVLAGNVVRAWLQAARIEAQREVAQRALAQREQQLRLVRDRVDAGIDTRLELRQSEGALPEARQQLEALAEQAELTRNALAALAGGPGTAPYEQPPSLARLRPLAAPQAIPADLLGRRADIAAARWRVEAATHDIESAKAQFYPNVNLTAFIGLSALGLSNLLDAGALQWGVGPAVRLPIFDAGRLRANLRTRTSDLDAAIETYNGAVVDALRDAADQLASVQSIARQQAQQRQSQEAAESAYQIALARYQAGLGNFLQVLSAETAVLNQRRLAVDLAARALDAQAALARSLGGGWSPGGQAREARDARDAGLANVVADTIPTSTPR